MLKYIYWYTKIWCWKFFFNRHYYLCHGSN